MRLALLLCLLAAAAAHGLETAPVENAAQDGDGLVWAWHRNQPGRVRRFDGERWTELPAPSSLLEKAIPVGGARLADGAIACLWRLEEGKIAVTRHTGWESRLLGLCEGEISSGAKVSLFADSKNRLWITGQFARIYVADENGLRIAHKITPEESDDKGEGYNEMHAMEDGDGRVWVWTDSQYSNYASLRGVLLFTEGNCELRNPLASLKGKLLAMAPADGQSLWLTVSGDGVYRMDIHTFALDRLPDPSPRALNRVRQLVVDGQDLYAVQDGPGFQCALWRRRDGQWTLAVPRLSQNTGDAQMRACLPIAEGLLVPSEGDGPWFVPTQGQAAQFSWRSGFDLQNAHSLIRLRDGTFFAIGHGEEIFRGPLSFPPREEESARVSDIHTDRGWQIDRAGRPWAVLQESPGALSEWDGAQWVGHPIPGEEKRTGPSDILLDHEGRVWIDPGETRKVHCFDPRSGLWATYSGFREACLALREDPPQFADNELFIYSPQYSPDRRKAAFRRGVVYLNYYDGAVWRELTRRQITGKDEDNAIGPPWFDPAGNLCVNLRNKMTWQCDADGHWTEIPFRNRFPEDIWSEQTNGRPTPDRTPPEGFVTRHPDSVAIDNFGTHWLTWQRELYRAVAGRWVKVFGPKEVNPFRSRRDLRSVYVDAHGNALVLASSALTQGFVIKPISPIPRTTLSVEPAGADAVVVRLNTESALPVERRWRLDQGPWQAAPESLLRLDHLANGPHEIAVTAIDSALQPQVVPSVARFDIQVDPERQIAELIALLRDPDFEQRKTAVRALAMQPVAAAAALRRAREAVDEDADWWIDATLQEIERRNRSLAPPPLRW